MAQRTYETTYELPGGMPVVAILQADEDAGRVTACYGPNGYPLDVHKIWIESDDLDVGLIPLALAIKLEAGETNESTT